MFLKNIKQVFLCIFSRKKILKIQITLLCGSQCCQSLLFLSPPRLIQDDKVKVH